MNPKEKRIMWTSILAPILIVMGVTLLVLGSIPIKNSIEDNTLIVHFVIGKKVIDITDARFLPVPDDVEISKPVCADDLEYPLDPNLEDIDPLTGIDNAIPLRFPVAAKFVVVAILNALAFLAASALSLALA